MKCFVPPLLFNYEWAGWRQMVKRCCCYFWVLQLWWAAAVGSAGFCRHDIHPSRRHSPGFRNCPRARMWMGEPGEWCHWVWGMQWQWHLGNCCKRITGAPAWEMSVLDTLLHEKTHKKWMFKNNTGQKCSEEGVWAEGTWVGGQMQGVNVVPFVFAFGLKNQLKD